jgi:hypothetical protein
MEPTKKREALVKAQVDAIKEGNIEDKIQTLIDIGVLTRDRKLAQKYKTWGKAVSRTDVEEQAK